MRLPKTWTSQNILLFTKQSPTTCIYNRLQMSAQAIKEDSDIMINVPEGYHAPLFNWDPKLTSPKLKLDESLLTCTSTQGSGFKTTVGTERFNAGGKYYFELFINKGQLIKVGVCRPAPINLEEAFCDTLAGWGIYNGETRHNSNSTGPKYGSQLQAGDILGIAVDMVDGKLEYFQNGTSWGVAFTDAELAQGQLVAAVSPIYVNDVFTLRTMMKQD